MVSKAQKIRLGIFLAIGLVLVILFFAVVVGNQLIEKRDTYYIQYTDTSVNGLQVGGTVNYHGIKVGRVENIKVSSKDITKVIITISVDSGTPIKKDVTANLVAVGITGLKLVELKGGTNKAPLLKPGSFITTSASAFDSLTESAVSVAQKLEVLLTNLSNMTNETNQKNLSSALQNLNMAVAENRVALTSTIRNIDLIVSENRSTLNSTLKNIDTVTKNAADLTQSTSQNIDNIAKSIDGILVRVNQIVNSPEIDRLVTNVTAFSDSLSASNVKQLVNNLNLTVRQANLTLNNVDKTVLRGRSDILEILDNLREASENLNEIAKLVNEDPSVLLRGRK